MMHKGTFWGNENVFQLDCGNGYRIIDLLKSLTSIKFNLHIQWGNFMKCKLYLNEAVFEKPMDREEGEKEIYTHILNYPEIQKFKRVILLLMKVAGRCLK